MPVRSVFAVFAKYRFSKVLGVNTPRCIQLRGNIGNRFDYSLKRNMWIVEECGFIVEEKLQILTLQISQEIVSVLKSIHVSELSAETFRSQLDISILTDFAATVTYCFQSKIRFSKCY